MSGAHGRRGVWPSAGRDLHTLVCVLRLVTQSAQAQAPATPWQSATDTYGGINCIHGEFWRGRRLRKLLAIRASPLPCPAPPTAHSCPHFCFAVSATACVAAWRLRAFILRGDLASLHAHLRTDTHTLSTPCSVQSTITLMMARWRAQDGFNFAQVCLHACARVAGACMHCVARASSIVLHK